MDKEDMGCVCVCVCVCVMEYYSAIKKNDILPFATTWMELECIMLSKISQRKTNTILFHSYVEYKKKQMNMWGGRGERKTSQETLNDREQTEG